ncbi:MAG: translocation/assembly module TamB domain-containing protein [Pseudomonadota bacterium]|nr:translocation/assembly module TamB domain-containing protein [Pseudomonadota bacterium]
MTPVRRGLKIAAWVAGILAALLVALGGALWVAGNTDPGRRLIEQLTVRLTAGQVELSGLGGAFPAQLTLERLQLRDGDGVWLSAERLSLLWSPMQLLRRRIQVNELQAARVHMERTPRAGKPQGGGVSIPHIEVDRFALATVELGAPLTGTAVTLSATGHVQLRSLQEATAELVARRLGGEGEYIVHLRLDPQRLDASLSVHEPASGPLENLLSLPGLGALSASATLAGPRHAARLELALQAGELEAGVHGSIDLTHLSADLDYALHAPALAPRPEVAWNHFELRGNWHGTVSSPTADARLEVAGLRIAGDTRVARVTAGLTARAGRLGMHAAVTGLEIPGPRPRLLADDPLELDASLRLDESRHIELTGAHPLFSLRAHADTESGTANRQHADVELLLPDVTPFAALAGQDVQGSAAIHAKLVRSGGDSTLALDGSIGLRGGTAAWIGALGPRVAVQLSGNLTDDAVKLHDLRVTANGMTLTASGGATRNPPSTGSQPEAADAAPFIKELQARWQIEVSNLAALSRDLAGDLRASGRLSGTPKALAGDAQITSRLSVRGSATGTVEARVHARGLPSEPGGTIEVHGLVDGAPLKVDATVERSGKSLQLRVRQASWKSAHLEGDLLADAALAQSHGQLRASIGELSDLDRLLGIHLTGNVDGSLGFLPAPGHTQAHFELDGKNLVMGPLAGSLHLQGTGTSAAMDLKLSAQLAQLYGKPASVTSAAVLNIDARELRLENLAIAYYGESFGLLSPARVSFAKAVSVDQFRLGAKEAVFELKGQLAPTLDLQASLRHVNAGLVNEFVPGLLFGGTVEASARLQGNPSSPTGTIRLDANHMLSADDAATGLPAADLHVLAELAADIATVNATLSGGPGSQITVSGTAPLTANGKLDLKLAGKLDVGAANPFLEGRGMHASGRLSVDATVTGSPAAPQVGGDITLAQGSLRDYGHGLTLSDIDADVVGREGGLQIKNFKARAASGNILMSGTFGILQPGMPLELKITARNAQPVASSIVTANLDADLEVKGSARSRLDVVGKIHVNRATVGIPNSLPPDVVVLDVHRRGETPAGPADNRLIIGIDIVIQAPRQVLVQGRGLDAELGGEIKLSGTADEPQASGGFDLQRGSFTLAGNKLEFKRGRVSFDGAGLRRKIDPTLDFVAETTVTDYTVTLAISGPADAPRFAFTSSPAGLAQDEILARLLFGQNAAQLTALQAAQIGYALATLSGVGGGSGPLARLQKTLGLDRLSVGSSTTTTATGATQNSGAAIAAGRYVSKRVYIEGKQTTAGTSQVQVDVDLTKHLKLQTRLGNGTAITQGTTPENDPGSSIGLSYQFEY